MSIEEHAYDQYPVSSIQSGSSQYPVSSIGSSIQSGSTSSYKERKKDSFKNLSFLSDSDFWTGQGLTEKKVLGWMKEFDLDEKAMQRQLVFGENTEKIKSADDSVAYFYTCLEKGITRPKGYESPKESRERINREEDELDKKADEAYEKLRVKAKARAFQTEMRLIIQDKAQVESIINSFELTTPALKRAVDIFKKTGDISERLESRIALWLRSDAANEECK